MVVTDFAIGFSESGLNSLCEAELMKKDAGGSWRMLDAQEDDFFLKVVEDVIIGLCFHNRESFCEELFGENVGSEFRKD